MKNIERVVVYSILGVMGLALVYTATPLKNFFSTESEQSAADPTPITPTPVQTAIPSPSKTTTTGLPDSAVTPGSVYSKDEQKICTGQILKRSVSATTKEEIYQKYGIFSKQKGQYEIDHLVALQLGGSNSRENLWPMTTPEHNLKTQLDNKLKDLVCKQKTLQLTQAQVAVKTDWIVAYKKYIVSPPGTQTLPISSPVSRPISQPVTVTQPSSQASKPHEILENNEKFFVTSEGVKVRVASSVHRPTKETVDSVNLSNKGRQDICDYYKIDYKYLDCDKK
jgi:hypothetical protein